MDGLVEDQDVLFPEIFLHLQEVEAQPATKPLDDDLLRRGERSLDASTDRRLLWRILGVGERLLQHLQQDPRPLTRLLEQGLRSPSIPVQLLCLAYLGKAADTPSGASFVACAPSLVKSLVTTWLASDSTEIAERALEDLVALLAVDSPQSVTILLTSSGMDEADGQGLFWRRIFNDPEVYALLFQWTSLVESKHDLSSKKGRQAATISQARLFDFVVRLATLDWAAITVTTHADIEKTYSHGNTTGEQPYGGLLKYAANGMIDKDDFLMEVLRQDFFMRLLQVVEEDNEREVPPRLITAIQEGAGVQNQENESNGVYL